MMCYKMGHSAVVSCLLLLSSSCINVSGSAIPMWEFLSRGEKMNHLFNMFVKQVEDYCGSLSMPDCNKVLLVYGLTNLAKMQEDSLDKMDPYQRGAMDIIWDSMMKGSYKTQSDINQSQDAAGNGPSPNGEGNTLGSQEEASSNVQQYLSADPNVPNRYVTGPMMVRVLPDGSPVPGDPVRPVPKDEDAEFRLMQSNPLPSIEDLVNRSPYKQEPQPSASSGSYQQPLLPDTETEQQKNPSQPIPSQFRITAV